MSKLFIFIGMAIGGWIGWWMGSYIGLMTSFVFSSFGSLIEVYMGWRIMKDNVKAQMTKKGTKPLEEVYS